MEVGGESSVPEPIQSQHRWSLNRPRSRTEANDFCGQKCPSTESIPLGDGQHKHVDTAQNMLAMKTEIPAAGHVTHP